MIEFKPVRLEDKQIIERHTMPSGILNCDLAFANMYCWQAMYHSAWAVIDGFLVIRFHIGGGEIGYMQPVGEGDFAGIIPALREDAHAHGQRLRLIGLTDEGREMIRNMHAGLFAFESDRALEDYVYNAEDLRNLTGRRYQPKRNHVNRFEALYDYTFEELRVEDIDECLRLEGEWQQRKEADEVDDVEHRTEHEYEMSEEQRAIRRAFDAYEALGLYGGVLRVEGRMVAFTYGSQITPEVFCTHIEKADSSYEGVFPMINRCFARALAARGYTMVNREEDMGLAGLRRSKMSYHPAAMQEKMTLRALSLREIECRELWQRVFGDDRAFIDLYLTEVYRPENMLVRCDEAGHIVSMLHIVEIDTTYGPTGYLYAIATDEAWRGRGLASALIEEAVEELRRRGMAAVMLIPSHEDLKAFYERLGFEESNYPLDFSEGFDFGTGDAKYDLAMVRPLK